jgi:fermentation-respiration switch protein FrsA (DUF1100 family)
MAAATDFPTPQPARPRRLPDIDLPRLLLNLALIGTIFYLTLCVSLFVWQRRMIFITGSERPDPVQAGVPTAQVLPITTPDGLTLNAWFQPPADASRPVMLFLHGNAGHIGHRAGRLAELAESGWGSLLLDYRGFGGNPGSPSENGVAIDARAAYDALRRMGIAESRIVLWGESLGTAIAVRLATEVPAAALILEAPFTSMADMARRRYSFVPIDTLLRDRFDSIARIASLRLPMLIVHGTEDALIPPAMGQRLADTATMADRTFRLIPGATHLDLADHGVIELGREFVEVRQGT